MSSFNLSPLYRCCLLALTAGSSFIAGAEESSPWEVTDGTTMDVSSGYAATEAKDYPLYARGEGSRLQTSQSGLIFETTGNLLHAAYAKDGASIYLDDSVLMTDGIQAHGAYLDGGSLEMRGGGIKVKGINSAGVYGKNGATVLLEGVEISAQSGGSTGIIMDDGVLEAKDTNIVALGANSSGISVGNGTSGHVSATLENVDILLEGKGFGAALEIGNADLNGTDVYISTAEETRGVDIYNTFGSGYGTLTLKDSNINTQFGDGIYIMRGEISLENTNVHTQGGVAVNVNTAAQATIQGGDFSTEGDYADGMWIASDDSSATISGAKFTTDGVGSHAINAQFGDAQLYQTSMETFGASSYGLYSEAQVQGHNLQIDTHGQGSVGVFSARGGEITLEGASIKTTGENSTGLLSYPGSTINANNVLLSTTGNNSRGLWVRDGGLNLSNSEVLAEGKGSTGLYISAGDTNSGSQVVLDNVRMATISGPAIKNDAAILDLTLKNGTQVISGNGVLLDDQASGTTPGVVNITADNHVMLEGDILTLAENQVDFTLTNTSQYTGAIKGIDSLSMDTSSAWYMTGNSNIDHLDNNGMVTFSHESDEFSTLTMETLVGNGAFAMSTEISTLSGDLIEVTGTASGSYQLYISDSGKEPQSPDDELTVVKTGGGDEHFALNGGAVDVGAYQYQLEEQGNDWVLVQKTTEDDGGSDDGGSGGGDGGNEDGGSGEGGGSGGDDGDSGKPVPTPTTLTALGLFNAVPNAWYGELTTLRTRMGEVREGKKDGGAWVRMLGNQYDVNDGAGVAYQQEQVGMSIGVDDVNDLESGKLMTGLFTGFSRSDLDFDDGSTGKIDSYFIGGYATWLLDSGWFVDSVVKANNFTSHADARMTNGEYADGGYSVPALGASVEVGRNITFGDNWFVEPSAQLASVWVKGDSYIFSNELEAESGSVTSHQGALSAVVGKTFELDNGATLQPWIRAAFVQEFSDDNSVSINGHHFNNDMSGARGEYGAGLSSQVRENLQVYADVRYAKGDKIESPWGGNLGVRWSW